MDKAPCFVNLGDIEIEQPETAASPVAVCEERLYQLWQGTKHMTSRGYDHPHKHKHVHTVDTKILQHFSGAWQKGTHPEKIQMLCNQSPVNKYTYIKYSSHVTDIFKSPVCVFLCVCVHSSVF